jgi:pre-mRNA-splicing factor ATP-dependent RNA helicase DHX16
VILIFKTNIIYIAKKASSVDSLLDALKDQEIPVNAQTQRFANDLYNKVPRKGAAQVKFSGNQWPILFINSFQPVNHEQFLKAVDYVKKNESYKLLEDDGDDKELVHSASTSKKDSEEKKSKRKQHARKKEENQWEDDTIKEEPAQKKVKTGKLLHPYYCLVLKLYLEYEDENERDLREREEFAERMRLKDDKSTKKVCTCNSFALITIY